MIGALTTAGHAKALWYLMRGTGLVSLILLTLTMVGGIAGIRGGAHPPARRAVRALMALVHRNLSLLAMVFLAVHIFTAETDKYVSVGVLATIVPFTSNWQPVWVGLGTLAIDVTIAVVVTSLLRARLAPPLWRAVHWLAYACWPLAVVHGFGAGTDSSAGWARAVYVAAIAAVLGAVGWRLGPRMTPSPSIRPIYREKVPS